MVPVVCSLKAYGITQSLPNANVPYPVYWGTKECDTDGMFSTSNQSLITAATPGYYRVHSVIAVPCQSSAMVFLATANVIYGPNNPNGASGTMIEFASAQTYAPAIATSGDDACVCVSGLSPYMAVGDSIQIQAECSVAGIEIDTGFRYTGHTNTAGSRDGASAFQCYLAQTATLSLTDGGSASTTATLTVDDGTAARTASATLDGGVA